MRSITGSVACFLIVLPLWLISLVGVAPVMLLGADDPSPEGEGTPDPLPNLILGDMYREAYEPSKAAEYYLEALKENPSDPVPLERLAGLLDDGKQRPKLDIAKRYMELGQYQKAADIYLEVLSSTPLYPDVRDDAIRAVENVHSPIRNWMQKAWILAQDVIGWIVIFLVLLIITRLVRKILGCIREKYGKKRYAVLSFTNATGQNSLAHAEIAVRATIVSYLYEDKKSVQHVPPEMVNPDLPDIGFGRVKLMTWIINQFWPRPRVAIIDGTLMAIPTNGGAAHTVILTVHKHSNLDDTINEMRTFKSSVGAPLSVTIGDYVKLARPAASWICEPKLDISPDEAERAHEANQLAIQAQIKQESNKKDEAFKLFMEAAKNAFDKSHRDYFNAAAAKLKPKKHGNTSASSPSPDNTE